jgi:demethylsterigmatocystin 6-O-methyltransferase
VNQDQEQVLKDALPTEGVDNKGLDFFKDQPVQGAKAYYLRNILHGTNMYSSASPGMLTLM